MLRVIAKRFLSLFVILIMVISLVPVTAFSAYGAEIGELDDKTIILTADGNGNWSASGTTITGNISGNGCNIKSTTLGIKNGRSEEATLSFNYVATIGTGDTMSVADENISTSKSDKKSLKIPAGNVVKITINVDGSDESSSSIIITDISLIVEKEAVEITFEPASDGGMYTVNDTNVTGLYKKTENSLYEYKLVATPATGYKFLGWYNETKRICKSRKFNIESNKK